MTHSKDPDDTCNGFSRRRFLEVATVLGASAAMASALQPGMAFAAPATPKAGGHARFAINDGAPSDSYDPAGWLTSFAQAAFGGTLTNGLTELAVDGSIVAALAESYQANGDLTVWTFTLRPGLVFHDGRPVTPNDVIASYRHHMSKDSTSGVKASLDTLTDISAKGEHDVVFTLSGGNADFPYTVSDNHLAIMPANADGSLDWQKGVATGPYMVESFQPGTVLKMKRNPHYFKKGLPWFDSVEFVSIADVAARTNALVTGEVDYMVDADIKTLAMLERNPKVHVLRTAGVRHFSFDMNAKVAPFDKPEVRLAMKYAMDREAILKKVFLGNAKIADDNPIAPQIKFATQPKPLHTYNPDKARALLKQAGLDSIEVDLSVADTAFPGAVDAALLYKDSAAKAGITINVIREADDSYWDKIWQHKPFVACDWLGKPTLDAMFTTSYASNGPWNDTGWANPTFDQLLVQGRGESDPVKRQAIYAQMQQILHDDGGAIVMVYAQFIDAVSDKIAHGPLGNMLQCDNFRMAERWWMA
ncbi:MAG TPA: ABC transporter substrate-binding protein [Pseudomonas sp.]|uniref:ABC transporter substrate-binding protein n=1 Tax=Pseudomonas sp. TaxID=306 RepID=UPI002ED8F4F2